MAESPENSRILIHPCRGHCGRMTRNSHHRLEDFPGTVARHRGGMCQFCWQNPDPTSIPAIPTSEQRAGLVPCKGSCGRMTRHSAMPMKDYPGTVTRIRKQRCHWCLEHGDEAGPPPERRHAVPKPYQKRDGRAASVTREVPAERVEKVSAELDAYTRARNERLARQERAKISQQLLRSRGGITPLRSAV
jgi:hypothetical protein